MRDEYEAFESTYPLRPDRDFDDWRRRLETLSAANAVTREATAGGPDGRRMSDLQVVCPPISVQSVRDNVSAILDRHVLLAEIDEVHVGFCVSLPSVTDSGPLFIQVVGVAPEAQRRGIGLALLNAAAARAPQRDIALATQDGNTAARTLNERFAHAIGARIERVALGTFPDRHLGIRRGLGYRPWILRRSNPRSSR